MEMDPLAVVLPQYALEEALAEHGARDEPDDSVVAGEEPAAADRDHGVASESQERHER